MEPYRFLEFAKRMRSQHVIDEETDSRVGIDRSYFAAAHVIWNTIFEWTKGEMGDSTAEDLGLLRDRIHTVIRMTLEKIHSPCNSRIRDLFNLRTQASYFLSARMDYGNLKDSIDMAEWILQGQKGLADCLDKALNAGLIDGYYWDAMRMRLDKRSKA